MFLTKFRKMCPLFLQIYFSALFSSLFLKFHLCICWIGDVAIEALCFFSLFFRLGNFYWSVFKFIDSSFLLLQFSVKPSSENFISDFVFFSSRISLCVCVCLWFFVLFVFPLIRLLHLFTHYDHNLFSIQEFICNSCIQVLVFYFEHPGHLMVYLYQHFSLNLSGICFFLLPSLSPFLPSMLMTFACVLNTLNDIL